MKVMGVTPVSQTTTNPYQWPKNCTSSKIACVHGIVAFKLFLSPHVSKRREEKPENFFDLAAKHKLELRHSLFLFATSSISKFQSRFLNLLNTYQHINLKSPWKAEILTATR
jgi:hypothetical protein